MRLNNIKGLHTNHTIRRTSRKYQIEGKLSLKRNYCTLCSTHQCISPVSPPGIKSLKKIKGNMKSKFYFNDFSII